MIVGLDTNILCYALDSAYPENAQCRKVLLELSPRFRVGINPTVFHEVYHTLVYSQKWMPKTAQRRLTLLLEHPHIDFYNQTERVCRAAIRMAVEHSLGGRDALIIANYLTSKVPTLYTHDSEILRLGEIEWGGLTIRFSDPTKKGPHETIAS